MENSDVIFKHYLDVQKAIKRNEGPVLGFDSESISEYKMYFEVEAGRKAEISRWHHHYGHKDTASEVEYCNLTHLLKQLEKQAPYAIGGEGSEIHTDFELMLKQTNSNKFDTVGSLTSLCIKSVLQYCDPSPFGDLVAQETKIDPSVRLAMECPAERIQIEPVHFLIDLRETIKEQLLQNSYPFIDLVLTKMNIYSEHGHFQPHTDTPTHDPSKFIGTVVVCLPSAHEGGDLIVRHAGQETVFNFADKSDDTSMIQFAAFYGDCEHQVQHVTAGHRVTLTYSILKTGSNFTDSFLESHEEIGGEMTVNVDTKSEAVDDAQLYPHTLAAIFTALQTEIKEGEHVGIFLSHEYTNPSLVAANLKGPDKLLYDFLSANQVAVSLVPVISSFRYEAFDGECCDGANFPQPAEIRLMTAFADPRLPEHKDIGSIPFLSGWPTNGLCIRYEESGSHHGGNDVSPGSVEKIYLKAAMIVGPVPGGACITEGVQLKEEQVTKKCKTEMVVEDVNNA